MDLDVLQQQLSQLADDLTAVRADECLWHYVDRMVEAHGCSRYWFTQRWVGQRPELDVKGTVRWLKRAGGYCDCEVLMNALTWPSPWLLRDRLVCPQVATWLTSGGCRDDDCPWVDCEDQAHGARPLVPGPCVPAV